MINSEVFLTLTNEYKLLQNLLPTSFKLYKILTQVNVFYKVEKLNNINMINAQSKRYGGNVFLNSIIIMIVILVLKYVLLSNSYLFKKIKFDISITDKLIFVLCDKSY